MDFKILMLPGATLNVNAADDDADDAQPEGGKLPPPAVPDEIQLAPLGAFSDDAGNAFTVTPEAISNIIAGFKAKVNDVPVDYEHQTLTGDKAPAAGWITELANKGKDGLWGKVKWTAAAAAHLSAKEYRYLSPVLLAKGKDSQGRFVPSKLHSAALTNTPKIDGMVPIVNKNALQKTQEDTMLKKIRTLLGLQDSATDSHVEEAIVALKSRPGVAPELADALGLKPDADLSSAKATALALKQTAVAQTDAASRLEALEKNLAERNAEDAVALAMKEGKITEAQRVWAKDYATKDLPGFQLFAAKAAAVVPVGASPSAQSGAPAAPTASLSPEVLLVAKNMGNTAEQIIKFGGNQ
ncbi:MAG: hypothetical protein HY243_12310 [Proteobacteria bacterium]|nr:hypothetical protein [Pseudomonadota bacterium]